jgi:hypothetical protein
VTRHLTRHLAMVGGITCVILFAGSSAGIAAADVVPKLDTRPTCESAGRKAMTHKGSIEVCLNSEKEAHGALVRHWSQYPKSDKSDCVGKVSKGGPPSYIELHSCLETLNHAREIRKVHGHSNLR